MAVDLGKGVESIVSGVGSSISKDFETGGTGITAGLLETLGGGFLAKGNVGKVSTGLKKFDVTADSLKNWSIFDPKNSGY